MDQAWIWLTVFAALMQSVRTAAQKQLNEWLSTLETTYVRALCGLPIMLAWLAAQHAYDPAVPQLNGTFFIWCLASALTQNLGTAAQLKLLQLRNFAVANQLVRTNVVFTAVIGALFFAEIISGLGWVGILLTVAGSALLSMPTRAAGAAGASGGPVGADLSLDWASVQLGLASGLMFGICNLTIRSASHSLEGGGPYLRAAITVAVVTAMQLVLLGLWLAWQEPGFLRRIARRWRLAAFIGLTSALGSIAWFAAFTLATAAYVIAVGQIEVVFGLVASLVYFRERVSRIDLLGMALTIAGVVLLKVAG